MSETRAEPVFFGPEDRPLFGWLHRASDACAPLGLILCNPFGYEAICAHRTLRHIAQTAAAAGIPVLRFDYDGTGDSAGTDLDPDRLRGWIDSVHAAVDAFRRELGCPNVVLLGIRLGATLATLAAIERKDVVGIIAIAPVVNAKAYLRELRALQMATGAAASSASSAGPEVTEATGFLITPATRDALNAVNLATLTAQPAPELLILDRDDLSGSERWVEQLTQHGCKVDRQVFKGYVEMMLSPHSTVVPLQGLAGSMDWLRVRVAKLQAASCISASIPSAAAVFRSAALIPPVPRARHSAYESLEFLDSNRSLFGVLSSPLPTARRPGEGSVSKSVLLLNAGATHHVGPNRMYVLLARMLASLGYVVLRMDISGIGDSLPRPGEAENIVYSACAVADIGEALKYLRTQAGGAECCVVGLCSGAYHALKSAAAGSTLAGLVMINPLTFFWKEGMSLDAKQSDQRVISEVQRYQQSAFKLSSWMKLLRGDVDLRNLLQVVYRLNSSALKHFLRDIGRRLHLPLKDDLGRELESVAQRGIDMRFVFAADDPGIELLRLQGGSVYQKLLRKRQLDVRVIDDADHTFTHHRAREELLESVSLAIRQRQTPGP